MEIAIKDEEAQRILAQAVRGLVEKHTEYFFAKQTYGIQESVVAVVREEMKKIVQEEVVKMLLEAKDLRNQIRIKLNELLTEEFTEKLVSKINVNISQY